MQERHQDRRRYFHEQALTTRRYVIPYLEEVMPVGAETRVFEIGCGEGGNLVPFLERGCACVGVDFNQPKIELGLDLIRRELPAADVELLVQDIYASSAARLGTFDLIILRDVIEHIHDQAKFLGMVGRFLRPEGRIFFGFPPWRMPFGGHQQICRSRVSQLPWIHLLPRPAYRGLLQAAGEADHHVADLLEIRDTGISIARFTELVTAAGYRFERKTHWLFNPNYEVKFGLRPRRLPAALTRLPWVKDFYTTCLYAVIRRA